MRHGAIFAPPRAEVSMRRALSTVVALLAAAGAACAFAQSAPQTQQPPQTQQQPPQAQQQPAQTQPQPERPRSAAAGGSATAPANAAEEPEARLICRDLDSSGGCHRRRVVPADDRASSE